jgi:hypothetical protein
MTGRFREPVLAVLAVAAGLAIAVLDSRPGWDDSGITAALLALAAFVVAAVSGRRPWLWALLVGVWTPLAEMPSSGATGSLLALAIAAIGAFAGFGLVRLLVRPAEG